MVKKNDCCNKQNAVKLCTFCVCVCAEHHRENSAATKKPPATQNPADFELEPGDPDQLNDVGGVDGEPTLDLRAEGLQVGM